MPTCTKILYRALLWVGIVASVFSIAGSAQQQEDKAQITPKDWTVSKKKEQGPRALALLKLTSTGKATLVPITIRIDGKFYDASAYKANPVPMALDSGTVYEGERGGSSAGLFTVGGALHSQAVNNPEPWIGTGVWLPTGTEAPRSGIKAETVPVGIENTDAPPKLSRSGNAPSANSKPDTAPASGTKPVDGTKPADGAKPADANPPKQETPKSPPPEAKPAEKSDTSSGSSTGRFGDDSNRPRLRRGKPIEPLPADEYVPGYGKPKPSSASATSGATTGATEAAWKVVQLIPAISDAGGPEPRSFVYEGSKEEDEDRYKQIVALAKAQLNAYLLNLAKGKIDATPAKSSATSKTASARRAAAKAPQPVFENVQVKTFDLWKNNQPVLVLSAEAQIPPSATGATSADTFASYTITLVARVDMYRNLVQLYSSVTDKYHLDVTPRLELIDAVDADGDGRGELLFRKTSDSSSGYVIYRAAADTLWKMFDSLNP